MRIEGLDELARFTPNGGYYSSMPKEGDTTSYMVEGSENGMITGSGKVSAFKGITQRGGAKGGFAMNNVAETYASIGQASDTSGYGNVMNVFAALFYIGKGLVRLAGLSLLVNASATLSLLIKRNGSYVTDAESGPWQAGLAAPSAAIITAVDPPAGQIGKVTGTVSVVIWRERSTTGAVSNQSPVSNVVSANAQSIAIQFPLPDANGQDAWGIGVTKAIEGKTGAHFELVQIMESDVAADPDRTYTVEWRDGDLVGSDYAPKRNFPPPAGLYAGTLEDLAFVDGCYADAVSNTSNTDRGTALAPSEPGHPEAYSPDTVIFTNDTPTGLLRGDGMYFRFGRNSVYSIQYLGGDKPLSMEQVWEGLGIQYQHQAVLGRGGQLHIWNASRGLLRMGQDGTPEGEWATPIHDDLIACTDPTKQVLGYDGISQVIAVCYNKKIWPFFTSLQKWGSPANLTGIGNIKSTITENNQLLLVDDNDDIFEYNVGTGSIMKIRTPWQMSAGSMDTIAAVVASVRVDNAVHPVVIKTFADGNDTTAVDTTSLTPARTGFQQLPVYWPNILDCDSHALEVTIQSTTANGDVGLESATTLGEMSGILV